MFVDHKVTDQSSIIPSVENHRLGEPFMGNGSFDDDRRLNRLEVPAIFCRIAIYSWIRIPARKCFPSS